jgi:hypothetical protein
VDEGTADALDALLLAAGRPVPSGRAGADPETALLQSVVDVAVILFEAQAASIALFDRDPDRLEFRVASGPQGAGVVGLSVPPTRGIAGYVFSTGQSIALSDVTADPRFDRATAERTGYVPRSIAAVPMSVGGVSVGVLQVLDRDGSPTFTLSDMDRLGVFAEQAAVAFGSNRIVREAALLLRGALARVSGDQPEDEAGPPADGGPMAALSMAAAELDAHDGPPLWRLVDALSRMGDVSERDVRVITAVLEVVTRHRPTAGAHRLRTR